jgi:hypothetical protein
MEFCSFFIIDAMRDLILARAWIRHIRTSLVRGRMLNAGPVPTLQSPAPAKAMPICFAYGFCSFLIAGLNKWTCSSALTAATTSIQSNANLSCIWILSAILPPAYNVGQGIFWGDGRVGQTVTFLLSDLFSSKPVCVCVCVCSLDFVSGPKSAFR